MAKEEAKEVLETAPVEEAVEAPAEAPVEETEEKYAKAGKKSKKHVEEVRAEE